MNWLLRECRLLPIMLVTIASLLALKLVGLVTAGGYVLGSPRPVQAEEPRAAPVSERLRAHDLFQNGEVTGALPAKSENAGAAPAAKEGDKPAPAAGQAAPTVKPAPEGKSIPVDGRPLSPGERAILERLQERRQELDQRARELEMRESLVVAAEKRLEARIVELKDAENRVNAAMNKKDEAEAARFKSLVSMYENMKAKDAAKIFDRLDLKVLIEVAGQINPRRMSDILALMSPEAAERLTVEMANRARASDRTPSINDLPKIEGRSG
jgi:flagellar motility protein MotE (MotC chaperone)